MLSLLALLACVLLDPAELDARLDPDGDGVPHAEDCDSEDASSHPGAPERCDGVDNDCDGEVDEAEAGTLWFRDADGDGYGVVSDRLRACEAPFGYASVAEDCDDRRRDVFPGAAETDCEDPRDYNCDGQVGGIDHDGDGAVACQDCDDNDASRAPGVQEICDRGNTDEDCDGLPDDEDPDATGKISFHVDEDGDGYGGEETRSACDPSAELVATAGDCDDTDGDVNPGAQEVCDPEDADEDCDGRPDDDDDEAEGKTPSWADVDGDGYGDRSRTNRVCDVSDGWVRNRTDCDDTDPATNPSATETSGDGIDSDCDGTETCYLDFDSDGYGRTITSSSDLSCAFPGYSARGGDCDDFSAAVRPGTTELTGDGVDSDCDGFESCYIDVDGDGYGGTTTGTSTDFSCRSGGFVTRGGDCDDGNAAVSPSAREYTGDGVDSDCDGVEQCYQDLDRDGYGSRVEVSSSSVTCSASGVSSRSDDCNDSVSTIRPGATESVGNERDDDCDGIEICYYDGDLDGLGSSSTIESVGNVTCTDDYESPNNRDCDDEDPFNSCSSGGGTEI